MAKLITLSLNRQLILEAVKADTFLTGQNDKASDNVKNASLAYNEQAGDEKYQERKLQRTLRSAVAKFEANLSEFVDSSEGSIKNTLPAANDQSPAFTITIIVSDRYNDGLADPLSSLAEEYIVNIMLYSWWQALKPTLADHYYQFAQESLTHIRMCLAKTAPVTGNADYTSVTGTVNGGAGDGKVTKIVVSTPYNDTYEAFVVSVNSIVQAFVSHGNLTMKCSEPAARLNVFLGDNSTPFITGLPSEYTFSNSDIIAIQAAAGDTSEAVLHFKPATGIDRSNVLVISYKEQS